MYLEFIRRLLLVERTEKMIFEIEFKNIPVVIRRGQEVTIRVPESAPDGAFVELRGVRTDGPVELWHGDKKLTAVGEYNAGQYPQEIGKKEKK
jgi:hypothetical protein